MAKKQHISRLEPPAFDAAKFAITGNLPTAETVNQSVAEVTGIEVVKTPTESTPSVKTAPAAPQMPQAEKLEKKIASVKTTRLDKIKAPAKIEKSSIERGRDARGALNRVGITALVDKDLLKQTKILAIQKGLSMSDIINDALTGYLNP